MKEHPALGGALSIFAGVVSDCRSKAMAANICKLDVLGRAFGGQEVVNTLWYLLDPPRSDALAAVTDLAVQFEAEVQSQWLAIQNNNYSIEALQIQAYDSSWVALFSPAPLFPRGLAGTITGIDVDGPALCMIVNFQLDLSAAVIPAGHKSPKRSYLAIGPLGENVVNTVGDVVFSNYPAGTIAALMERLAFGLTLTGTSAAIPIRVGRVIDPSPLRAYAPVLSAAPRLHASFRRSRVY